VAVEAQRVEDFKLEKEPYYLPVADEIELYEAAYHAGLPVMLKGPTGCGKTRFVEHMSWRLGRTLITVACHEDLTYVETRPSGRTDRSRPQSSPAGSPTWTRSWRPARTPPSSSIR
jgi:hypothetical protein